MKALFRLCRQSAGRSQPRVAAWWYVIGAAFAAILLPGCMSYRPQPDRAYESAPAGPATQSRMAAEKRPGLGTGWGEERDSNVDQTTFVRENRTQPDVVDWIYYNDREGIQAMIDHLRVAYDGRVEHGRSAGNPKNIAWGLVKAGIRDGSGRWLEARFVGDHLAVIGERGDRYEIVVRNTSNERLELVLSVDGLDVMDGRSASFRKRGYIVGPGQSVTVDGFRTSFNTVAAFRFSNVDRSYVALKTGDTRNVGVIGIAVFKEARYLRRPIRQQANPFPGSRWATPPN